MSRLANKLVQQIAGGNPPATLNARLAELRQRYGTVTAAAKAAGIDRRTFQRYESGKIRSPKADTVNKLDRAIREARLRDQGVTNSNLKVSFKYDGRTRELGNQNLKLRPGTTDSMRRAYVAGDIEGVARAFIDGIAEPWYHARFDESYEADAADATGEGSDSLGAFV